MMGKASFPFRLCLLLQRFPLYFRTCHAADLIARGRIFFQNFFPIFPFKACKQRNRRIASADAVGFFQLRIEAQHDMHIILPDHSADDRSKQTRRVYKANVDCGLRRGIILLFPILHRRTLTETARSGAPCGILLAPPPPQAHLADRSDR